MNDWTMDTLHRHLELLINNRYDTILALMGERAKLLDERFSAQNDALSRADHALERAQGAANEWRGALEDSRITFVTRTEWDSAHREDTTRFNSETQLIMDRMDVIRQVNQAIDSRLVRLESRSGYISITMVISVMSFFVAVGVAVLTVIQRL